MLELNSLGTRIASRHYCFSLTARPGQCISILGKSGAGKSTLLNLIGGFIKPVSGSLSWCGKDLTYLPVAQRPVTTLFQDHNLFAHLSVFENVALGIDPGLKLSRVQRDQVTTTLAQLGIDSISRQKPAEISGGEAQRAALARCLLRRQPILLLDEPFSALDEQNRAQVLQVTRDVLQARQLCTLLVTHNRADARALGASGLVLTDGQLHTDNELSARG